MPSNHTLRILHYDASHDKTWVEEKPLQPPILGPVDYGVRHHLEAGTYEKPPLSPDNTLILGRGVFAGGAAFGTHRIVAVFRSPVSRGIHVSTMGGAATSLARTPYHMIAIHGRSEEPRVLVVDARGEKPEAWTWELPWDQLWETWRGYAGYRGVRALAALLSDRHSDCIKAPRTRVIATGPAAAKTIMAGLFSPVVTGPRRFDPAGYDSAARGGPGSVMLRGHGVAAIVVCGGDRTPADENPRLADRRLLDEISRKVLGKPYIQAVNAATTKYRYDPRLGTGGTFGVNYVHYRSLVPLLGYNTVYLSRPTRERLLAIVLDRLWRPIQEEAIAARNRRWGTCGEVCPAACKKVWRGTKIDYEPSNAQGPFIGVFDAEKAKELIDLVDDLGLDAIETGHIVAWLLDLVTRGLLHPEELGLPREEPPTLDPLTAATAPEDVTRRNAEAAKRIIQDLVEQHNPITTLVATRGLRAAAQALNTRYPARTAMHHQAFQDPAVYAAFGDRGYMTPNLYWSPGVVAPMPLLGRYWTVYSPTFNEPEAMAETAYNRALNELLVDNAGICRFHRKWAEKLLDHLYREIWGLELNLRRHAAETLALIKAYQEKAGAEPRPWETRKVIDMVAGIAAETGYNDWAVRLATQPEKAAREWWTRFKQHLDKLLARDLGQAQNTNQATQGSN